ASQQVAINVGQIDFADPGLLLLSATAKSRTNVAVQDTDTAAVNIASLQDVDAAFVPNTKQLPAPGVTSFLLQVDNIGNIEDAYSATIVGTTGPVTVSL